MNRFAVAAVVSLALLPGSTTAQLQSVEQSIYGMD